MPARRAAATSTTPESVYADTTSIARRADSVDRYIEAHPGAVRLYAKLLNRLDLVPVKDSTAWPDGTEASYNIVSDSLGRPLVHREIPLSESGDWYAVESHYFAPTGRTILHEYRISGFSSGCTEILHEIKRTYLDPRGRTLAVVRRSTDRNGAPVVADSCYRRSDAAPEAKRTASELPFPATTP